MATDLCIIAMNHEDMIMEKQVVATTFAIMGSIGLFFRRHLWGNSISGTSVDSQPLISWGSLYGY